MQRFIILTKGRSGSKYLSNWLNSHPHVLSLGELIHRRRRSIALLSWVQIHKTQRMYFLVRFIFRHRYIGCVLSLLLPKLLNEYIEFIFQNCLSLKDPAKSEKSRLPMHTRGFKVIYTQLFLFWRMKKPLFRTKIIHLVRRDVLAIYISLYLARTTGIYHVKFKTIQPPVRLPIRFIKFKLNMIRLQQAYFTKLIKRFNTIEIYYTDLFNDKQEETEKRILRFLNVKEMKMTIPDQVKLAPADLKERISNYPELVKRLKNTRYAQYL